MTGIDIDRYRQQLEQLKARVAGDVITLQADALRPIGSDTSGGLSDVPLHLAERSSASYEEDVALELLGKESDILSEVEAALARIEAGRFGLCTKCGATLTRERLAALPFARFCVGCESKHEKES
jgi:DnaK suppressor protein